MDDPYGVEKLAPLSKLLDVPQSVEPQSYYRVADTAEKVFCHLCGGHRHKLGMVGRCLDDSRILFGSECARLYFGSDIWKRLEASQDIAISKANDEFRGIWIRENIGATVAWLDTNGRLLRSIITAWTELFYHHRDMTRELLDELGRQRGRLTETDDTEASSIATSAGFENRGFSTTRIILVVPAWEGISSIGSVDAELAAIRLLCDAVLAIEEPGVEDFSRWDSYLSTKVRRGAANIDNFVRFSVALFQDGVLEACGNWLDRRRLQRLKEKEAILPRSADRLLRSRVGYGYEAPSSRLQDALPDFSLGRTIGKNATRMLVGV